MSHYREECVHGLVAGQCRCPGPKPIRPVSCERVADHDAKLKAMSPRTARFYQRGQEVIFRYFHGEEVAGVVSSTNDVNVFVRFPRPDGTLRDTAEACSPDRLRLAGEPWTGDDGLQDPS